MGKIDKKTRNHSLYRATKCPTEAEKIEYEKVSQFLTSEDKNETQIQQNFILVL